MAEFVKVAEIDDVPEGMGIMVQLGERSVALFNVGGSFYAINNACPHAGGPLADGFLAGAEVTCPWHMWSFNVKDGSCSYDPRIRVPTYPVRVDGATILLDAAQSQHPTD